MSYKKNQSQYPEIIHYCCGRYPDVGGVARFDLQLSLVFPKRKYFEGGNKKGLLRFLSQKIQDFLAILEDTIDSVMHYLYLIIYLQTTYPKKVLY